METAGDVGRALQRRLRNDGDSSSDEGDMAVTQLSEEMELVVQAHEQGDLLASMQLVNLCLRWELYAVAKGLLLHVLATNDKLGHRKDPLLHLNAQFQLGVLLYDNLARDTDQQDAEQRGLELMKAVAAADPAVLRVPKDGILVDAMHLTTSALFNIGCAHFHGSGLPRDLDEAVRYWKLASKDGTYHGSDQAMNMLGIFYSNSYRIREDDALLYTTPDYDEAYSWHTCAHKNGNIDSTCRLGLMHQAGQGCRQDDRTALDFLKKAAAAGHDMAETALCVHYYRMRLFHKAVQWARRVVQPLLDCPDLQAMIAAQSPDITKAQATCCWHLSRCCANGTGVPSKDTAEAQRLFSLALRIDEQTVAALEKTAVQAERQS